jgi:hypothetical protein
MGLEVKRAALNETTFVRKVPDYIQTYLGDNAVAPLAPEHRTILSHDAARICVEAGGTIDRRYGCVLPDGSRLDPGNGSGAPFEVKPWMYVAGGVGVLGLLWYFTK